MEGFPASTEPTNPRTGYIRYPSSYSKKWQLLNIINTPSLGVSTLTVRPENSPAGACRRKDSLRAATRRARGTFSSVLKLLCSAPNGDHEDALAAGTRFQAPHTTIMDKDLQVYNDVRIYFSSCSAPATWRQALKSRISARPEAALRRRSAHATRDLKVIFIGSPRYKGV